MLQENKLREQLIQQEKQRACNSVDFVEILRIHITEQSPNKRHKGKTERTVLGRLCAKDEIPGQTKARQRDNDHDHKPQKMGGCSLHRSGKLTQPCTQFKVLEHFAVQNKYSQ